MKTTPNPPRPALIASRLRGPGKAAAWVGAATVAMVMFTADGVGAQLSAPFTRITTGELVTLPALYWNGAWGDYDNDGFLDLFVGATYPSTRNYLYHNKHDGTFELIDDAAMPKIPSNQHGAAWGDYDNDGNLDLIVTAGNPEVTHNALYHNNGDGSFTAVTTGPIYEETFLLGFHAPSWADYDNDGFLDLFIAGHDIRNRLFHNNGDGTFTRDASSVLVSTVIASEGHAWFDFDDDGSSALKGALYRNEGNGVFSTMPDSDLTDSASGTFAVCVGDYDNDGLSDVFLARSNKNLLFHNTRGGTFTRVTTGPIVEHMNAPGTVSPSCAWADYDNDGFLDLFVGMGCYPASSTCQPLHSLLYHNNGDGTFTEVTEGSVVTSNVTQTPGAAWGDYDNDGFLDLFLSQGALWPTPVQNLLFHNDGNANGWLKIKLVGTVSNRSAIGAKVRVKAFYRGGPRWQLRTIASGDGESNQTNALEATFGLADATAVDTVRVEWPSGIVQELHDVAPRQFLTITEDLCSARTCDDTGTCTQVATPDPACAMPMSPGKATLALWRSPGNPSKNRLRFRWGSGPAVDRADLGTAPATGAPLFDLCIYDRDGATTTQLFGGQAFAGTRCGSRSCWIPISDLGWRFVSRSGMPDGLTHLTLKSGIAGKGEMSVRGGGPLLTLPKLPLLRTSTGKCWGATFSTPRENSARRFSAKSD